MHKNYGFLRANRAGIRSKSIQWSLMWWNVIQSSTGMFRVTVTAWSRFVTDNWRILPLSTATDMDAQLILKVELQVNKLKKKAEWRPALTVSIDQESPHGWPDWHMEATPHCHTTANVNCFVMWCKEWSTHRHIPAHRQQISCTQPSTTQHSKCRRACNGIFNFTLQPP